MFKPLTRLSIDADGRYVWPHGLWTARTSLGSLGL